MKSRRIIFWILLSILSLALLEGVLQFTSLFVADKPAVLSTAAANNQIWTFGESTSVWGGDHSYPNLLQKKIDQGSSSKFELVNYAGTGSNSSVQLKNFKAALLNGKPKMAIAMVGINDDWALPNEGVLHGYLWKFRTYRMGYLIYVNSFKEWFRYKSILVQPKKDYYPMNLEFKTAQTIEELITIKEFSRVENIIEQQPKQLQRDYFYLASIYVNAKFGTMNDLISLNQQIRFLSQCLAADPDFLPCIEHIIECKSNANHPFNSIEPYINVALEKKTEYPNVYQSVLNEYRKIGQTEKGLVIVEEFLKAHPIEYIFLWRNFTDSMKMDTDLARRTYWKNLYEKEFPGRTNSTNEFKLKEHFETHAQFVSNLKEFASICAANNIQFVFVQYPRLSIAKIKEIPDHAVKIIWVENKDNFENALKTHTYDDLFTDRFSPSFGHFTPFGAELVAEEVYKNIKDKLR